MENFNSRRSTALSLDGMVASTQPLANRIGQRILAQGGNAADAAVAMAAALNVTEPCSTGIGGDCFCLYFDATTKKVHGLNGSGRTSANTTLEAVRASGIAGDKLPWDHALTVTVPGAAAGWVDTIEHFGTMTMQQVLQPAIDLARQGAPIHHVAARSWAGAQASALQSSANPGGQAMLLQGQPPAEGQVMVMPELAATFELLASKGKSGFYQGRIAQAIVDCVQEHGGILTLEDLEQHRSTLDDPLYVDYAGVRLWEMPPNGQGLTALLALNILEHIPGFESLEINSTQYLHFVIEAVRLAFADTTFYVADPAVSAVPIAELLSESYAAQRAKLIRPDVAMAEPDRGSPVNSCDTVLLTVTDKAGNACSFINSNYMGFGSCLVPTGCGFTLQNRGANFVLQSGHPNCIGPRKRPYHTIIPGLVTNADSGELYMTFGVMGGFMQPQGHVQVLLNLIQHGLSPQAALDAPRFCVGPGHEGAAGGVALEEGISAQVQAELAAMGHEVELLTGYDRSRFGRGQVIRQEMQAASDGTTRRVWAAGSDPRGDGAAVPA
ncbi:uncharacterized protein MONBRDRAFT_33978 [Monosiga brevicollis MX1]|uniref:Gamma-glutamyltransferase n=1 Tax=Monosiga brevicollis TaxID=81824 RepID=A9V8W3_MONBE|nr:uncharacterized protein MONBRDRAFT_33978 [Monosiga brevicollis MX1]EDQ86029.1 predicted protein [Monosiga brevicollis MX1]|eukprot:XP_001749223.1 hypothetical protein [Monosiga brevicollis MX1]